MALRAAAQLTPSWAHSFHSPANGDAKMWISTETETFYVDFFFWSIQLEPHKIVAVRQLLFCPRALGLLQTGSSSRECQSIMRLVQESAHILLLSGLLLASHGKFMYSVLLTWALGCRKWTMFTVTFVYRWWVDLFYKFYSCMNTHCLLRTIMWVNLLFIFNWETTA